MVVSDSTTAATVTKDVAAARRENGMPSLFVRELPMTVAMPLESAAYCADCEAVFDMRRNRACPACSSSITVPVSSLINKSSWLAQACR